MDQGWWRPATIGQAGGLAIDPGVPGPPSSRPSPPAGAERSWRGLAVGLAIGIAVVLLLVAVLVATQKGDDDPVAQPATTQPASTVPSSPPSSSTRPSPGETGTVPATSRAAPLPIVAADERRVVVLDPAGSAAPRTLFDLGPSSSSDEAPPFIGGVALSADGRQAYFDIAGTPAIGALRRVAVAGGPVEDLGQGVGAVPSPDGSTLALIRVPDPEQPEASLVLRPLAGGGERRFDLGEEACSNITWSPSSREVAVDICSGSEPVTVAHVDVTTGAVRRLTPPDGVTWSAPAFKPDATLTLVEQRGDDAVVVALTPDRTRVAASILRRPSTTITAIDWSSAGDLLACDIDGILITALGGGQPRQVATGYAAAAW